jgi:hypothetical protein
VQTYNRRTLLCAAAAGSLLPARAQPASPAARMRLGMLRSNEHWDSKINIEKMG